MIYLKEISTSGCSWRRRLHLIGVRTAHGFYNCERVQFYYHFRLIESDEKRLQNESENCNLERMYTWIIAVIFSYDYSASGGDENNNYYYERLYNDGLFVSLM